MAFGGVALWQLGYPDQAVTRSREAVSLGEELDQPCTIALALHFAAILRQYRREPRAVYKIAELAAAITSEHGLSFWFAGSQVMRGWAQTALGDSAGLALLRQGMAAWEATGSESMRTYYLALLAECLGK